MANITQYRHKCIGCGICYEMMPELWRISTKDGKASLVNATLKKQTSVLSIPPSLVPESGKVAAACPVKVIKVNK